MVTTPRLSKFVFLIMVCISFTWVWSLSPEFYSGYYGTEIDKEGPWLIHRLEFPDSGFQCWCNLVNKEAAPLCNPLPTHRERAQDEWLCLRDKVYFDSKGLHWLLFPLKTSIPIWKNTWCAEKIVSWGVYFCDHKNIPRRHLCIHPLTRLVNSCFGSSVRMQKLVFMFLIWLHHDLWAPQISHVSNVTMVYFTGTGSSGIHYYPLPSRLILTCQRGVKR